jgi:hypothetical protein
MGVTIHYHGGLEHIMMKAIWLRMLGPCVNWAGYDRRQRYIAVD